MPTTSGGSANIYGVLYQSLRYLDRAGAVTLRQHRRAEDETLFVLEPAGGGGDLQLHGAAGDVIEQIKAKSDGGSWSLTKIIESVLPDLYLAVDECQHERPTHYRFVTEGYRGNWAEVERFFRSLSQRDTGAGLVEALDDHRVLTNSSGAPEYTERSLFLAVAQRCQQRRPGDLQSTVHRKVWHLLSHFRIRPLLSHERVRDRLKRTFVRLIDDPTTIDEFIDRAVGWVIKRSARGPLELTPPVLLNALGLSHRPLARWRMIRAAALRASARRLRRIPYRREDDVRPSPITHSHWPNDNPVLIVPGESGQGSTWQSARLAHHIASSNSIVVWLKAGSSAEQTLQDAAAVVWGEVMHRFGAIPNLEQLSRLRREQAPHSPTPWITIVVDEVKSVRDARVLTDQDWRGWGARVAIFTTPPIARALAKEFAADVKVANEIGDFTGPQLRRLLELHHMHAEEIPPDLFDLLRRPVLAGTYLKLDGLSGWQPRSEYEVCARYWRRLTTYQNQADHPSDLVGLRRLALRLVDDGTYPWHGETLAACGIDDAMRRRLEQIGWLQRPADDDRAEVWHDRLLNWALAEAIVARRRQGRAKGFVPRHALLAQVQAVEDLNLNGKPDRLGYVYGDVLWLLTRTGEREDAADAAAILAATDEREAFGHWCEQNYLHTVATLGVQVLPVLERRLRDTAERNWNPLPEYIAQCVLRIAKDAPQACDDQAEEWLADDCSTLHAAATHVLTERPSAAALDRLWSHHRRVAQRLDELPFQERPHRDYERGNRALRAGTATHPEWLIRRIQDEDDTDVTWELAWLLATSPPGPTDDAWSGLKPILFQRVAPSHRRAMIACIRRFRDTAEISRLEQWIRDSGGKVEGGIAFGALADLDAHRALTSVEHLDPTTLYMWRQDWLPILLERCPEAVRRLIREQIQVADSRRFGAAEYYQGNEHLIDPRTLDILLKRLEQRLDREVSEPSKDGHRLHVPLELLLKVNAPECLRRFRAYASSPVERKLTRLAIQWSKQWIRTAGGHELPKALRVLLRIGSDGLTELVNQELQAPVGQRWHVGTRWAAIRPDGATRKHLVETAHSVDGTPEPGVDQQLDAGTAIQALVAVGDVGTAADLLTADRPLSFIGSVPEFRDGKLELEQTMFDRLLDACRKRGVRSWPLLLLLARTRRPEAAMFFRQLASQLTPEEGIASTVLEAMDICGHLTPQDGPLLRKFLDHPNTCEPAVRALLRISWTTALTEFAQATAEDIGPGRWSIAARFCEEPAGRERLLAQLAEEVVASHHAAPAYAIYNVLGNSRRADVGDLLRKDAHDDRSIVGAAAHALRGLTLHDPEAAYRTGITAWTRWKRDRYLLPAILLEADHEAGSTFLIHAMAEERDPKVRCAIGRALRITGALENLWAQLIHLVKDHDVKAQRAAIELLGWMPPCRVEVDAALRLVMDSQPVPENQRLVFQALDNRLRERQAMQLVADAESCREHALVCLLAVSHLVDLEFAQHNDDPLGFIRASRTLLAPEMRLLGESIERRERDLEQTWKLAAQEERRR